MAHTNRRTDRNFRRLRRRAFTTRADRRGTRRQIRLRAAAASAGFRY